MFTDDTPQPVTQAYVDRDNGFQIDWPQNGKWIQNPNMVQYLSTNLEANFPLYIGYYQAFGEFTPNINVSVVL